MIHIIWNISQNRHQNGILEGRRKSKLLRLLLLLHATLNNVT
jgi:hypothetical protein